MIVVDTNVVAYCWINVERTPIAQRVRLRDPAWHAPVLWRSELRSVLANYIRRGTLSVDEAADIAKTAESALAGCEHLGSSRDVLELAEQSGLSAYDCEFVALARSLVVPLVTEDRAVLKAFPDVAMGMETFLASFTPMPPAAHERRARYAVSTRRGRHSSRGKVATTR